MPHTNPWKLAGEENDSPLASDSPSVSTEGEGSLLDSDDHIVIPIHPPIPQQEESPKLSFLEPKKEDLESQIQFQTEQQEKTDPSLLPNMKDSSLPLQAVNDQPSSISFYNPEKQKEKTSSIEEKISLNLREEGKEDKDSTHFYHKKIAIVMASIGGFLFLLGILPFVTDSELRANMFGNEEVEDLITSAVDIEVTPIVSEVANERSPTALPSQTPSSLNEEIYALLQTPTPIPQIQPSSASATPSPLASVTALPSAPPLPTAAFEQNKNVGLSDTMGRAFNIPDTPERMHNAPQTPVNAVTNATSAASGKNLPPKNSTTGPEHFFLFFFLSVFGVFLFRARSLFRDIS